MPMFSNALASQARKVRTLADTIGLKPLRLRALADQVIVITGASSGIGLLTARKAAAAGAKVVLVARNDEALEEAVAGIEAAGGTATYAVADVGVAEQVEAAARHAVERFGRIDTWVNNAGVTIYALLADTPIDEHERLFQTNYFGVVNGVQAALPHLKAHGGALITVASVVSDVPAAIMGAYAASKHAIKGYINSLRLELRAESAPVSVTLVKPSGTDTPVGRHAANHREGEAMIPPPVYDPAIVADAILHAARHPRRDVTIGGLGRLGVLFGTHFPSLFEYIGRFMVPLLNDPRRASTPGDSLFAHARDGQERSGIKSGRSFSLYTSAERHRGVIAVAAAALTGAALITWQRRRSALNG